jgi:hypothetical protein
MAIANRLLFSWDSTRKCKPPPRENQTRCLLRRQLQFLKRKVGIRSHGLALAISPNPRMTSVHTVHGGPSLPIPCTQNPRL